MSFFATSYPRARRFLSGVRLLRPVAIAMAIVLSALSASALDDEARERGLYESARQLSEQAEQGFSDEAQRELQGYIQMFPRGRFLDDVYLRLARVHLAINEHRLAAGRLLQVILLCPGSLREAAAREELTTILASRRLRNLRPRYEKALETYATSDADPTTRRLSVVNALLLIDDGEMVDIVANASIDLLADPPGDDEFALAMFAVADYQRRHRAPRAAVATLERLAQLWPTAPFCSRAVLAAGEVTEKDLETPVEAMKRYRIVVRDHSDRPEAATAWLRMGEIERRVLKRPEIALRNFDEVLNRYSDHPDAFTAMLAKAETLREGLRDPHAAVDALVVGANRYAQHTRAPEALELAGDIADHDLHDPRLAAGYYADLADRYPRYEPAPEKLMRGGQLLDKAGEVGSARDFYQRIIALYPQSKQAAQARRRLDKLPAVTAAP